MIWVVIVVKRALPVVLGAVLAGPALAGPMLAGPVLAGPVLAGPVLAGPVLAAPAAAASPALPGLSVETVPYAMDASNQAGWWRPLAERGGDTYLAFNAPSDASEHRHEVHLARRTSSGQWSAGCLPDPAGDCVDYVDDIGHNQPSIALDGGGHVHAFVSMHNDQWRYYRSAQPGSVTTMVDRSGELPDQDTAVTYPVTATAPNGDVYLIARVNPGDGYSGRLYRWSNAEGTWQRVAVFAQQSGFTPYPDDLEVDRAGRVHILWEWARGGPSGSRYYGSYLVYEPRDGRFTSAGGREVDLPASTTDREVVYEPGEGVVQSARFALVNTSAPRLAGVAYRYRPPAGENFEIRWASWNGQEWDRETVDNGGFGSPAAIAATHHGAIARVYYVKQPRCDELELIERGGLFAAEKQIRPGGGAPAGWRHRWLGGGAGVERLAAATRRDGTDVLYLAAPNDQHPTADPALQLAALERPRPATPAASPAASPGASPDGPGDGGDGGDGGERTNLAYGAPVSVSSTLSDTAIGECAVDGNSWADHSRWISAASDPEPTIAIDFGEPVRIAEVHVHSGHQGGTTALVRDFVVEALVEGQWREVGQVRDNRLNPAIILVPEPTYAPQLRIRMPGGIVRIYEVEVYATIEASPVAVSLSAEPGFLPFPGDNVELQATLVNRTPEPVTGTAVVDLPAGWTAEPTGHAYQLDPHGQVSVSYTVTSPADAGSPAVYPLTVRTSPDDPGGTLHLSIRDGIVYSGDGAPFYTETSGWADSSLRGHDDSSTRYTEGGSGASATWTPVLRRAGSYRVHMWHPTNPGTTTQARVTVAHAGGSTELVVNQRDTGDAWHPLGTWQFDEGTGGSVTIESVAPGYHRAGAVWFEWVSG